jgi:hypothetical protein
MSRSTFAAQADSRSDVKARSAGRSHTRADELEKDSRREAQRAIKDRQR